MRGVPLRLEIGPQGHREAAGAAGTPRHAREAATPMDGLAGARGAGCSTRSSAACSSGPWRSARSTRTRVDTYDEFKKVMEGRPGFVIAPWCGSADCEAQIKAETQATIRNMPLGEQRTGGRCVKCGGAAGGRGLVREGVLASRSRCRAWAEARRCDPGSVQLRSNSVRAASGQRASIRLSAAWRRVIRSRRTMVRKVSASCPGHEPSSAGPAAVART